MINLMVTITDNQFTDFTFNFNRYKTKEKILSALENKYGVKESQIENVVVYIETNNQALLSLLDDAWLQWNWTYAPYDLEILASVKNNEELIKILWAYLDMDFRTIEETFNFIAGSTDDEYALYENSDELFKSWVSKYNVHPDISNWIDTDSVIEHFYPSHKVFSDGSILVFNW